MRLVDNWREIALKSYAMWAGYFGLFCLVLPEWYFDQYQTEIMGPQFWWFAGLAGIVFGLVGRLVKQKSVDRTRLQSPWLIVVAAVGLALFVAGGDWSRQESSSLSSDNVSLSADVADALIDQGVARDEAFLAIAVPFIGRWEGLRLEAYRDIVGVLTVCYGETKGVNSGDSYTKAECDAMLAREVIDYRDRLRPSMTAETVAERLPVARDVAFTSTAYNVGVAAFGRSTAIKRLNAGDVAGACSGLTMWNRAGGRVVRGLVNRRKDEYDLCMRGVA